MGCLMVGHFQKLDYSSPKIWLHSSTEDHCGTLPSTGLSSIFDIIA